MRDRIIERRDHVADTPVPGRVQDFQRDDSCCRGDPGTCARRVRAVTGDDSGDVRAVTVIVVGGRRSRDEINELINPLSWWGRVRQVIERLSDSRVDHGDADAGSVESEFLSNRRRADGRAGALHRARDRTIERQMVDRVARRQQRQRCIRKRRRDAVDDRQREADGASQLLNDHPHCWHGGRVAGDRDDAGASRQQVWVPCCRNGSSLLGIWAADRNASTSRKKTITVRLTGRRLALAFTGSRFQSEADVTSECRTRKLRQHRAHPATNVLKV